MFMTFRAMYVTYKWLSMLTLEKGASDGGYLRHFFLEFWLVLLRVSFLGLVSWHLFSGYVFALNVSAILSIET